MTSSYWMSAAKGVELIERARSQAIRARRHLLANSPGHDDRSELAAARNMLVAASQALEAAAMDSALPTKMTNALVDSWAGLDAFLLAAGELDEEPTGADAHNLFSRAATFLIETLPGPVARVGVGVR